MSKMSGISIGAIENKQKVRKSAKKSCVFVWRQKMVWELLPAKLQKKAKN